MIRIIKEVTANGEICIIRSNSYSSTYEHISMLVAEAKKDFPNLDDSKIELKFYAEGSAGRTYGIEFNVAEYKDSIHTSSAKIPESYQMVDHLLQTR